MAQNAWEKVQALTAQLNRYRDEYYNGNAPSVSDAVYDRMYDELALLEMETGIWMTDSPTRTVGFEAVSGLEKTGHPIPLLSLEKTKSVEELVFFAGEHQILLMLKLDGLTVKLTYEDGKLLEAATRGDGDIGEVVTHNVRGISGIPQNIPYLERLVVSGEAFIRPGDFQRLQETLTDSNGERYKNERNLASGSVRLLDSAACRGRKVMYMPFAVVEGFPELGLKSQKLQKLPELGFQVCKFVISRRSLTCQEMEEGIRKLEQFAGDNDIPIDGIVASYNDIAFSQSCGRTGHHYKDGLAFKFEDELHETKLLSIEWNPSRSGEISPVAVFRPVEIDGCQVSRASLHNLSFIEGMELKPGCRILASKRNMIIPHVEENLDHGDFSLAEVIPDKCPCCGEPTRVHESRSIEDGKEKITKTLFCDNPDCETRRLRRFVHFAGQKAMNIEGLSEATLEKFIGRGWIHTYMDIYGLDRHRSEIIQMEGFGEKSWQRLWDAIQESRNTTFERYLIAMDIPMVGNTASRTLCRQFHGSLKEFEDAVHHQYDFTQLPDFGDTLHNNIHEWFYVEENLYVWEVLQQMLNIESKVLEERTVLAPENPFAGMTIVVTGKVEPYTRSGINAKIESLGARAGSSVSSKTDYLVCGEKAGSKLAKARELGVKVLTPEQFFRMAGE